MAWNIAVAAVLSLVTGGWMLFDGVRALVSGDYTTPRSGPHHGELGPWAGIVSRLGIDPRATAMKLVFVAFGIGWLVVAAGLWAGAAGTPVLAIILSVATLWYVPVGSVLAILVLLLVGGAPFTA